MRNNLPFISLVLSPREFGNRMLEIRMIDNEDWGELFSFLIWEEIDVVVFDNKVKLFSPPRERKKSFKKSPCERVSLVWICETPKH